MWVRVRSHILHATSRRTVISFIYTVKATRNIKPKIASKKSEKMYSHDKQWVCLWNVRGIMIHLHIAVVVTLSHKRKSVNKLQRQSSTSRERRTRPHYAYQNREQSPQTIRTRPNWRRQQKYSGSSRNTCRSHFQCLASCPLCHHSSKKRYIHSFINAFKIPTNGYL